MKNTKVKICGIKDETIALNSIKAGADFLGFNFSPKSKRQISSSKFKEIVNQIPNEFKLVKIVFLFFQNSKEEINNILATFSPDYIQYVSRDNSVDLKFLKSFSIPLIPQIGISSPTTNEELPDEEILILDSFHKEEGGGTGKVFPWENVRNISKNYFLAGGLNPNNVELAVKTLNPFGVDVASGVEIEPGMKDIELIKEFIKNAKGT
ncbi:MAG: phosphoribosylanthranilate isomerase [Leptospiraceae bacterium]|nr:phosphoribosylanthranilate isomerase [Leptospiraceae bacterium]